MSCMLCCRACPPPPRALPALTPDRPLYEEVRAHLTEGIAEGRWKAGEAIPPEARARRPLRRGHRHHPQGRRQPRRAGRAGAPPGQGHLRHRPRRAPPHVPLLPHRGRGRRRRPIPRCAPSPSSATARTRRRPPPSRIARDERVIRIRNVLSLGGGPVIVDDITLPAALFPGLTERIFAAPRQHHLPPLPEPLRHQRAAHRRAAARRARRGRRRPRLLGVAAGQPAPRDPPRGAHLPRPPRGASRLAREHGGARLPQHLRQGRGGSRPCRPRSSSCPTSS